MTPEQQTQFEDIADRVVHDVLTLTDLNLGQALDTVAAMMQGVAHGAFSKIQGQDLDQPLVLDATMGQIVILPAGGKVDDFFTRKYHEQDDTAAA